MFKYLKYCFILLIISIASILEARKINLKGDNSSSSNISTFGDNNFEFELTSFQNSIHNKDITNKYYGWVPNTNTHIKGDPNAIKGGRFTMLGGWEFPNTFRSFGKDSRSQINGEIDDLQNEGLLKFNYEKLEWYPCIATHWKISEDSLSYWFRIDPRARWADGKEIISDDIVAAFKLLSDDGHQDPNTANYYKELFNVPESLSKYVVKITTKRKDWRTFRTAASFYPMPSFYLNKIDGAGYLEKYNFSFWPGSGPYEYDSENSKKGNEGYIILKRRENYWAKDHSRNIGLNNFDEIKFIFIEDENQRIISFFNGDYDIYPWSRAQFWVERFTKENYKEIEKGWIQKVKIYNYLPKGPSGIVFNTQKKPYDNINIRKAFSHLFDVEKLNKRLFFNEYIRLNTFFFGTPYSNPRNSFTEYSPERALKLLNNEGWERKKGEQWLKNNSDEIFECKFLMSPGDERIYSTFQEDLKQVGIKMEFEQVDNNAAFSKTMKKEYEITSQGWTAGFFPSPEGMMHSKYADKVEVTNITSMAIPELDKLIETYNAEWDAKKRVPIAQKIDSIAVNQYHYALGWTSPYGARMLYWNKLDMPKWGLYYESGWQSPITLWWINPEKDKKLKESKDTNTSMPLNTQIIDYWNRR